jgi:peptidoglycan/xylan/chitin deacetylase (PgdA/CDA1 family)/SAM-dependent methyltransferase
MKRDLVRFAVPLDNCRSLFGGSAPTAREAIRFALTLAKCLRLFRLARYLTRGGLRILCYHGFAVAEEYKYRGRLFIRRELFRRRIEYLQRERYPIVPLHEAVEALRTGCLPHCATAITMDDGWRGVYSRVLPIIKELRVPVTVYVTTYYIEHPMPVYSVTLSYLFWRTQAHRVRLPRGLGAFQLDSEAAKVKAVSVAQEFGASLAAEDRLKFLKEMADALSVSYTAIEQQQLFQLLDENEIRQLAEAGVDIQLHTHRHQWSLDDKVMIEREIRDNRNFLERIVSHALIHFCYPNGTYGLHQGEWLAALGVSSATTIDPGLNYPDTSRFALRRMVDGEPVSDIEFEAEVTGFMELMRAAREKRLLKMLRRGIHASQRPDQACLEIEEARQTSSAVECVAIQHGAEFYDRVHAETNDCETKAIFYPLFRKVVNKVRQHGSRSVLEVGCGSGLLADMLIQESGAAYRGFDFSEVAIGRAGSRTGRPELFSFADARDARSYAFDYDTIICTEVLEHIDADLDVIRNWNGGAWCVCSVPNFDWESHVRFFRSSEEVRGRYGELIDIETVIRVPRPVIPGGDIRRYLRNLRWSRNDPSELLGFLGIQTFKRLGGWFLFWGIKKHPDRTAPREQQITISDTLAT